MNERITGGPNGPQFSAWLRKHDPESITIREEAAVVAARLDEVLSEPLRVRATLEEALVKAMEHEAEQAKKSAKYWQDEAINQFNHVVDAERRAAEFKRKVKVYAWTAAACLLPLILWLAVR